jgi:transcriptional regulator
MYIPPSFRMDEAEARRFVRAHPFAVLFSLRANGAPWATHLPLIWEDDDAASLLIGHVARANPHWRDLDGAPVLAVFSGPHAYISPSWYGVDPSVPTWNYLAVHVTGVCRTHPADPDRAVAILDRLRHFFEPEAPALPADLARHPYFGQQLDAIVALTVEVQRIEGAAKLGQNRPVADRLGAAAGLEGTGRHDDRVVATLMRDTVTASHGE